MGIREKLTSYLAKTGDVREGQSEIELFLAVASSLGLPFYDQKANDIVALRGAIEHPSIQSVGISKWKDFYAAPLLIESERAKVLIADPFIADLSRSITFLLGGKNVELIMTTESHLLQILDKAGKDFSSMDLQLQMDEMPTLSVQTSSSLDTAQEASIKPEDVSAPLVIRLVDKIFSDAIDQGASDVHVTPTAKNLDVKVRVDGILKDLLIVPNNLKQPVTARMKLLCGMDIAERRKPQDGRLRLKTGNTPVDLRVSTVPSVYGETVVARLLSTKTTKLELDGIGLTPLMRQSLERALKSSSKVLLVAGPTGSGKTSTLYAALSQIADGTKNIITIEDPVEYRIEGITQMQVNNKTDMTFAQGLRSALRQDPDVIMVGEIRDLETAQISMQAAQTGHLVLSTIHTNTAEGSITRLLDLGVPSYLIASSVSTIIAQRLVRRVLPDGTYGGRIGVFSILELTPEVADLIRNKASEREITAVAASQGFLTLWEHADQLIAAGLTNNEEVERVLGPKPTASEKPRSVESAKSFGKRKLLLVEDDDTARTVLSMLFEDEFFEVIQACNGHEGLEKIYKHQPEIVISDLMMPKMSGLEMLRKMKGDTRLASIPVLMLTAAAHEENELDLIKQGADDFVSKSADSKVLLARVERILARY